MYSKECIFHAEFRYRYENLNFEFFLKKLENFGTSSALDIRAQRVNIIAGKSSKKSMNLLLHLTAAAQIAHYISRLKVADILNLFSNKMDLDQVL